MIFGKKDARKIAKATREELSKVQEEYEALMGSVNSMSPAGLLVLALAGIGVILSFRNNVLDVIGLAMLLYPLYILVQRGAHKKGYFEGYYDMMTKVSSPAAHADSDKPHHG